MQELYQILEVIGKHSEGITLVFAIVLLTLGIFFKKEDKDLSKVSKINELQNTNLEKVISQNTELYNQLTEVREELRNAYVIIDELRQKIMELEDMLKKSESERSNSNSGGPLIIRREV